MFRLTGPDGSDFPGQARPGSTLEEAARAQGGEFWFPSSRPAVPRGLDHDTAGAPRSPAASPGRSVGQVRGVLAERVVVSTELDPFLPLKALAGYGGLSVRKLREYLDDSSHPLPHYRVGGKILVRRSVFDGWIAAYLTRSPSEVDRIVSDVLKDLS